MSTASESLATANIDGNVEDMGADKQPAGPDFQQSSLKTLAGQAVLVLRLKAIDAGKTVTSYKEQVPSNNEDDPEATKNNDAPDGDDAPDANPKTVPSNNEDDSEATKNNDAPDATTRRTPSCPVCIICVILS